jgi:hypothetical protein
MWPPNLLKNNPNALAVVKIEPNVESEINIFFSYCFRLLLKMKNLLSAGRRLNINLISIFLLE